MSDVIDRLIGALVRRPLVVLGVAAVLTAAGAARAVRLPIQTDLASLLPESYLSVRTLRSIGERVGGFETLQILVQGADLATITRYADDLADSLRSSEMVKLVDHRRDPAFFQRHALLYVPLEDLERIRDAIRRGPDSATAGGSVFAAALTGRLRTRAAATVRFIDSVLADHSPGTGPAYYLKPDSSALALTVFPEGQNSDIAFARRFFDDIRGIVETTRPGSYHPGLTVAYGGNFKNKLDEYAVLIADVRSTAGLGLAGILIVLVLYFRRPLAVVWVGVPLGMSLTWTFGLTEIVIGELNTMTVFLFVVLFGLGIDFGIHFLARYAEERGGGREAEAAVVRTVRTTGRALLTSAATTAAAFYTVAFTDFKGFSQFGFIAGTGILLALLATVTVTPALLILARPHDLSLVTAPPARPGRRFFSLPRWAAAAVLGPALALAVFGTLRAGRIGFEYDFGNLRTNLPQSVEVKDRLGEIFRESNSPAVVLLDDPGQLPALEAAVEDRRRRDSSPTIARLRSVRDALPQDQEKKLAVIAEIRGMLDRVARARLSADERARLARFQALTEVGPVGVAHLPEYVTRGFTDRDGRVGTFAYIYPAVALRDGRNAIAFAEDARTLRAPGGREFHAASSSIVFADMLVLMRREGIQVAVTTSAAVVLLIFLSRRRVRDTAFVVAPLALGLAWTAALMSLGEVRLSIFNLVAIPTVIGLGVDSAVHVYGRYREEGTGSVPTVLRHTGGAVAASALTTMMGFGGLLLAHHPGLNAIGWLAVTGVGAVALASLLVLPAALRLTEGRGAGARVPVAPAEHGA